MRYFVFKVLLIFLLVSCSSNNDETPSNDQQSQEGVDLIVGSWDYTGRGLIYEDGTVEITDTTCSNSQKYRFFEGGIFEVEIWWLVDGVCTFDIIRDGNFLKTTNSDFPDSNYRLRFYRTSEDDEIISFPQIIFEGNNRMRIQYPWETSGIDGVTHRFHDYRRE